MFDFYMLDPGSIIVGLIVLAIIIIVSCVKIVPQANSYVVERLGAFHAVWQTGIHFKIPFIDRIAKRVFFEGTGS